MKQFTDGSNNFPLEEKSISSTGSSPTAANFNGVTAELVNVIRQANFPLDPMSGALTGSDDNSLMDSESNKQIVRSIDFMIQNAYLRTVQDNNRIIQHIIGQGRIHGLEVTKTDTLIVSLAEGLGYSSLGQAIVLTEPLTLDLSSQASDTEHTIEIGLRYSIQEPNYIIGAADLQYKAQEIITPVFGAVLEADVLSIAKITIDETGITTIVMTALYKEKQDLKDFKRSFPVGYQYTQYADENTSLFNNGKSPTSLFGSFGNWRIMYSSKSTFFRTEGTEATQGRGDDGIQMDALQSHIHQTHIGGHNHATDIGSHNHSYLVSRGSFDWGSRDEWVIKHGGGGDRYWTESTNLGTKYSNTVDYGTKDSGNPYGTDVRAASETRVKNAKIRIYELISYKELY